MRMRRWTRDRNMLMVVVITLGLCSPLRHVAAETELEVLEEVSDALSHADLSLEALRDLVEDVITTTTKSTSSATTTAAITTKTTTATKSSSSATTTAAITTDKTTTATKSSSSATTTSAITTPKATTATKSSSSATTTSAITTPKATTTTKSSSSATTTSAITTPKATTTTKSSSSATTTSAITTPKATTATKSSSSATTTAAITTPTTTTTTSPTTTTTTASTASTISTLSPTTTAPSTTITSVTPPTTTSVTTPTTTTIVTTSPNVTTSAPISLTTSLSTSISTDDDDRSSVNLSEDFPSVLRHFKIWNWERLLHAVQGTRRLSSGDVFPFPLPIALVKQSADSEHYKKQKSLSRVDPIKGVLTERLHELMSEPDNLAWGTRVNDCLRAMKNETAEIYGGSVDKIHAQQLEKEATQLDELVQEGSNDTSLVVEGELVDFGLIDSVQENINNASLMVDDMISEEKADNTEMLVTIVMLSLLFVVVLIGLIVAFVRPWARKSSLKSSRSKWTAGSAVAEDVRTFPDARFMQHSHVYTDPYRSSDTKV